MNTISSISAQKSGNPSSTDVQIENISKKIKDMMGRNPELLKAVDKVRNDPKSMKRLAILPKLADKANKSLGCELTEFDLIEHSLITKKDERVTQASTFLDSIGYMKGFGCDNKTLSKLFMNGPDANIGSKYEELWSGARPIVSALVDGGFLAYEKSAMPDTIYRFIKDFKNASRNSKFEKFLGIVGNGTLLGYSLHSGFASGDKLRFGLAVLVLLGAGLNLAADKKNKKKASTITQDAISNDLLKALGKNTI